MAELQDVEGDAHTRLIVKPGMATEARACHTKVSTTATVTLLLRPCLRARYLVGTRDP